VLKRVAIIGSVLVLLCVLLPAMPASAAGASGTIKDTDGQGVSGAFVMLFDNTATAVGYAISDADGNINFLDPASGLPLDDTTVNDLNGFVVEQPDVSLGPAPDQLGIYQHQPRSYLKPPNTSVDMVVPATSSFVIKAYKQDGVSLMRWADFLSTGPGQEGAQFLYLTDLDQEEQPSVVWPTYDEWARQPPRNQDRQYGLPSLVTDSRRPGKYAIGVLYWNVKDYGKLCLYADNAGEGFDLPSQGDSLVIDLNTELARTAISDLYRREDFLASNIYDEDVGTDIEAVEAVTNVDDRLSGALQLRDRLELKAAQNSIENVRKGWLQVTARDVNMHPVRNCTVTIDQTSHDFLFGGNGGAPFTQQLPVWNKVKEAGFELAPILPAWGFTEDPDPPYDYLGKDAIEATFGIGQLLDMGFKVKFTGSVWMQGDMDGILPERTDGMPWQQVAIENLVNQGYLLDDFKDDPIIWEAMNEPATTNTVGMPRPDMAELMTQSALQIKDANSSIGTLVNSPSEFDFGFSYQTYSLDANGGDDNLSVNNYSTTYSDFLKQARDSVGDLDAIDTIGLQFYPGCHVSPTYGAGEAPAFTPSWLVDTADRYNALFDKPVHITEMSCPSSYDLATWHSGYWRQPWDEATQADYAESVYTMMFADPNVHSILWWDMCDTGAFVVDGGLIKADYSGKPSYDRIKGLVATWTTTDESETTDASGDAWLWGFAGDYDVTVTAPDGKVISTTGHINEQDSSSLVVDGFNAQPWIDSMSPTSAKIGDPAFELTVSGSEFVAGSQVMWNGAALDTTYVSAGELTATVSEQDLSSEGIQMVTVQNPGGLESNEAVFMVEAPLQPLIDSISPDHKTAGDAGFTLTVNGQNFVSGCLVTWNGEERPTTYVSDKKLTATISRFDLVSAGTASVTVFKPGFGGGSSNEMTFNILAKPTPPGPTATPVWYLAEGTSDYGFDTYVNIENPNAKPVTALVTYMTKAGPRTRAPLVLPAMSQTVINPRNDIGATDFSTRVECKEGKSIVVDRRMIWTGPGAPCQEGTSSVGVTAPAKTWYLAEGSSKWGFETWLLIQNPGTAKAHCTVTYMTESAGPQTFSKTVEPGSRASFNMETDIGQADASIKVESDQPIIPERAMYRNNRREGHDSIGTTSPARDYYLAEGTTDWGFTTYVLVQNPNNAANTVNVTCMTPGGAVPLAPLTVPANSRRTIRLNDALPGKDVSTHVSGSLPLIAERAMYWGTGGPMGEACHDSIGMSAPHSVCYMPDGETQNGYETWTLVQNPNSVPVTVEVTYMSPSGTGNVTFTDSVAANSRRSYNMADKVPSGRASVMVRSKTTGKKIMCERAMYWNSRGAGTDTIGGFSD
jgi:hypothetical protein